MRFAIFALHLSKVLRLPRKMRPGHTKCCTCHAKSSSQNWRSQALKCKPLSGNQRPDLLTALMKMSLVLRLPRKMHLSRSSSNVPRLPSFLEMLQNPHVLLTFDKVHNPLCLPRETTLNIQKWREHVVFCTFWLRNVLRATGACTFSTSQLPRVVWTPGVFNILTWKCASRHNGVHFSTSQLPRVVRGWCALYILTWKCASRHNGVQFFISHVARWLRTRRFSEPTYRPSGEIIGKTQCFATFLPFRAPASSFFWLFLLSDRLCSTLLFSLTLSISAFHLSILSPSEPDMEGQYMHK